MDSVLTSNSFELGLKRKLIHLAKNILAQNLACHLYNSGRLRQINRRPNHQTCEHNINITRINNLVVFHT